jgi:DNA-binding response OmpR family regulator
MPEETEPHFAAAPELEVLVVEDDPEINELVGAYVQIVGFRYYGVGTSEAAARAVASRHPALVILDVMLPDGDGFEICRRIKSDPATADTPILMLTALDRPELRQRGLQCGAVEYLTKPFDPDRLLAAIRTHAAPNHHPTDAAHGHSVGPL